MSIHHRLRQTAGAVAILAVVTIGASDGAEFAPVATVNWSLAEYSNELNPLYGNINPFYGNISPFWGRIDPFWGTINPFYGKIDAFWGDISPTYGRIDPFWGSIHPFWSDLGPRWGTINAFWGNISAFSSTTQPDYVKLQGMMRDVYNRSQTVWNSRIKEKTGKTFKSAFADALLKKYGLNLDDPKTFQNFSAEKRSRFFLDWYDGLMAYSGTDRVDHWMATVNWSPSLTQDQGSGKDSTIGLLDMAVSNDGDILNHVKYKGGFTSISNGHGAAVASLMVASHDGTGIMGISPQAAVHNYNPFDHTGTASWQKVRDGIVNLGKEGADVINMSLGVSGWTLESDWKAILSASDVRSQAGNAVFVKAAGNDGLTQTQDIAWDFAKIKDNLIVVGSVDPNANISTFSNTPGEACLLDNGVCHEANKLKYRFMVAPGELILVSDDTNGVTRMSGTSFSAPIVTGAISLMHDRWPWLTAHPDETVQIVLETAQDLGAPGVDGVYGWGLLDVEASQSPLNFDNLVIYKPNSKYSNPDKLYMYDKTSTASFKASVLVPGQLALWQNKSAYIYAFESVGDTYRDFSIPLSTLLNQKAMKLDNFEERFQRHLTQRLIDWAKGGTFTDMGSSEVAVGEFGNWNLSMVATDRPNEETAESQSFSAAMIMRQEKAGLSFSIGSGEAAQAFSSHSAFAFASDYEVETGGVNPFLGFASGGEYAKASLDVLEDTTLSLSFSQEADDHSYVDPITGESAQAISGLEAYEASALVVSASQEITEGMTLSVNYTQLTEATGLMGAQGMGALGLSGGAVTDGVTVGADVALTADLDLSASVTAGRTRATEFEDSALALSDEGVSSTAFAIAALKRGIFEENDRMRVSLTQPLHLESGALTYSSIHVVDRDTGEVGVVTDTWDLAEKDREVLAGATYAMPLLEKAAELSFFGELDFNAAGENSGLQDFAVGTRLDVVF